MAKHYIFDSNQFFYRNSYRIDQGLQKHLTYQGQEGLFGLTKDEDISYLFYMMTSIESQLHDLSYSDSVFSFCFEGGKPKRTEINSDYKSNRDGKLSEEGKLAIFRASKILKEIGYNVFSLPGYEADDVGHELVNQYKDKFQHTILNTNDADWMINLSENVTIEWYQQGRYREVTPNTFEKYLSDAYKCQVPYNSILLYKCLVGDKSDCIKGVKGFGPKAFDKLISKMKETGFYRFSSLADPEMVKQVVLICYSNGFFNKWTETQLNEALESLTLITPKEITKEFHVDCSNLGNPEELIRKRKEVYEALGFNKLASQHRE